MDEQKSYKTFILRLNVAIGLYVGTVGGFLLGPLFLGQDPPYLGDQVLIQALLGAAGGALVGIVYGVCAMMLVEKDDDEAEEHSAH